MADLLTHLLVAYAVLTAVSWRVDWLDRPWVVVGVGGAAIPDLVKLDVVLDDAAVSATLGVPFSYEALSTLGGVVLVAGVLALAFPRRGRAVGLVAAGGVLSVLGDGLRMYADGRASAWLYPVSNWRPPTPNLYVSADPRVLLVALLFAGVVWLVDRRVAGSSPTR